MKWIENEFIFSIFFVFCINATIKSLSFQAESNFDIGVVIVPSLFLFLFMIKGKKRSLERWEGIVSLFQYGGYIAFPIIDGQRRIIILWECRNLPASLIRI